MHYFCSVDERKGTCYHEFYRGKWEQHDFWNSNSLLLHDDMLLDTELYKAFNAILPNYDCFGETEVTPNEWFSVQEYTREHLSEEAQKALAEIEDWINDVFKNEGVFTIVGI